MVKYEVKYAIKSYNKKPGLNVPIPQNFYELILFIYSQVNEFVIKKTSSFYFYVNLR